MIFTKIFGKFYGSPHITAFFLENFFAYEVRLVINFHKKIGKP